MSDTNSDYSHASSRNEGGAGNYRDTSGHSNKQAMLPPIVRSQYSFIAMLIDHQTMFDWVSFFALLLGDLELLSFFYSPVMARRYAIAPIFVANIPARGLDDDKTTDVLIGAIVLTIIAFVPPAISILIRYQSQGTKTFRFLVSIVRLCTMVFPTALFIPFVGALMLPFDCRAGFACSSSLYVAGTVVAAFGLAMFFIESVYMTVFFFDADPTQKNPWNVYNARVDMLLVLLKAGLVSIAVFAPENDFFGRAFPAAVVPLVMFIMHNLFFPHYNIYMTQARCGIYFGAFFHGVAAIICGAVSGGTTVIESATGAMMTIFCVMVPIGAYISGRVFTYTQSTLLAKINERKALSYSRGVWSDDLNIFRMWPHVEITARFATAHLFGRRRPRKEDFALVICIFRRGLAEFPNNPYVMSLYAQYLSKFVGDNEHALHVANKIDIERTYMDTQFQIYMMLETKEKDKELEFLDINTHLDRATLNEYSRIIMDTKLNHYMTLHYTRLIWGAVLDKKYDAGRIENLAEQLQLTILKAEDGYVKLMERFPNSSRVRRYYSYFCLWTLNADVKANRLLMEADQRDRQRSEQESRSGGNRERTAYTDIVIPARMLQTSKASTEENREKESKRLRLKLLKRNSGDIRKLLYATTIIGIISTTVLIVGHTVVAQLLETSIHEYKFTKKIIMRDLGTALLWRRCRQLQTAYESSKPVEFKAIQDKLYKEMVSFQENARAMFADTASSSILVDGQRAFSDPWITYKQSFYPELASGPIEKKGSLLDVTVLLSNSGLVLSSLDMAQFNHSKLYYNNDFRLIADNWYKLQEGAYDVSSTTYFNNHRKSAQSATILIYVLICTHIATFAVFIVILDVVLVRRFRSKQAEMLEAFRIIPLNAKNEKLTALEEAQQDDILEFEQTFSNKTQLSSKKVQHRSFRNEYIAYTFATISLAVSVALLNTENVNHIGRVVVITDQMATVNIQSLRTINLIQELKWNDHMTWGSEAVIRDNIVEEVESAAKIYQYVLYGNKDRDNESPPANTYLEPEDLDDNFTSCLAANTTFCETRTYNATIGYTKDILEHGVLRLQDRLMTLFNRFSVAASVGPVVLDEASVKFMDMVVEPDLLDGWQERQEDQSHNLDHFLEEATHVNHWIMAAEVLTIVVGQFVVFTRMINYFLFLDRCNVELLVRLPRDIRKLPEFARFLSECLSRNQQVGTITTFLVRIGLKKPPNRGREDDTDILKELRRKSVGKEAGAEERESTDARIHKLGDQGGGGDAGGGGGGAKRTSLFASMFKRGDMDSGGDDSGGNGSQSMLDNYAIDNRIDQWESAHGAEVDNPFESPVRASTDRRSARKGHDTDDDDDDDYDIDSGGGLDSADSHGAPAVQATLRASLTARSAGPASARNSTDKRSSSGEVRPSNSGTFMSRLMGSVTARAPSSPPLPADHDAPFSVGSDGDYTTSSPEHSLLAAPDIEITLSPPPGAASDSPPAVSRISVADMPYLPGARPSRARRASRFID